MLELGSDAAMTPRGLRVLLGFGSWAEVEAWVAADPMRSPYWWYEPAMRAAGRTVFERVTAAEATPT